ncbi:hypothetical protein [Kitasatospora sp. NPDC089509]|uniref:DUF7507 domain-containing protein n=1 Tax=Kitasatospora sp. NPDC089509 TaxID=3364079 RepID=UPI0038108885
MRFLRRPRDRKSAAPHARPQPTGAPGQGSRWRSVIAGTVTAGLLLALSPLAVAGTGHRAREGHRAPRAAGDTLDCSGRTIYGIEQSSGSPSRLVAVSTGAIGPAQVTPTTVSTFPAGSFSANALGITNGGTAAYALNYPDANGNAFVYAYTAATGTWASYPVRLNQPFFVAGAVNPDNGIFYFANYGAGTANSPGVGTLYGFDTTTNTFIGVVGTFNLPFNSAGFPNGDITFDGAGNMYVLAQSGTDTVLSLVQGPMPTTPGSQRLTLQKLSSITNPTADSYNGDAFDNAGNLYVSFNRRQPDGTTRAQLERINPNTGKVTAGPSMSANTALFSDLASCALNPTLALQKNVVGRFAQTTSSNDQFALSITGGGVTQNNKATTAGTATGIQPQSAGPVIGRPGQTYTLAETGASGADLANYTSTYACVDTANDNAAVASGNGTTITLPFPAAQPERPSPNILCTFTNTPNPAKPALSLVKTVQEKQFTGPGQVLHYEFVVTNTGNVTLTDVAVTETEFSGTGTKPTVVCPNTAKSMAPGAGVTCTATYTVTQADIDAGRVTNAATATGTPPSGPPPVSPPSRVDVPSPPNPGISVVKSAEEKSFAKAGDVLHYDFLVTNTGNVTLTNVAVNETQFSGTGTPPTVVCPDGAKSMAPGAKVTCTATYTVTQADVDAGKVTNAATATGTPPSGPPPVSPPSQTEVPSLPNPAVSVVKSAEEKSYGKAGDVLHYDFLVTNTGNVTLTDVAVNETAFSGTGTKPAVVCPDAAKSMAPGAKVTCTATYTVTQADVDAGKVTNAATATGTPPSGPPPVSPPSQTEVPSPPNPAITVVKSVEEKQFTGPGQVLHYDFVVTNTGNVTLTDVAVNETQFSGTGTKPTITCPDAAKSMAPGAQVTCTATYTVTQADVDAGNVTNAATATGTPPSGPPPVSPPSHADVPSPPNPGISVVKSAEEKSFAKAGDVLHYDFLVTNTGNVTLADVAVTETAFSGTGTKPTIVCPDAAKSMAPGAKVTCTATYTVTQADVDAGKVTNAATATGTPPSGPPPVSPPSQVEVPSPPNPAISVVKSAEEKSYGKAGDVLHYDFLVTNTGNVTLANVAVNETAFSGTGTKPAVTCPDAAKSLAPGANVTCTATYTVTQADVDAGKITNAATATGTPPSGPPPVSPPSQTEVPSPPNPAISVVKSAEEKSFAKAGDVLHYDFLVTNTGNVTLANVAVNETAFSGTGTKPTVVCPDAAKSLAPGANVTCTATYTVTQADVDAGNVTNAATATGTPPSGPPPVSPPSEIEVPSPPNPAIALVKSAEEKSYGKTGDVLHYDFLVTNTGNVTLANVAVTETAFSGTGTKPAVTCPDAAKSLAPGGNVTCTATYTVTQADVDAGKVTNAATSTGTPPSGPPPVSPPSEIEVPSPPNPAITLVKSVEEKQFTGPGQVLHYEFVATNTGNVTLTNVTVTETAFSGTGTKPTVVCPDTAKSMAPGDQVTCTATYTVTQADIDTGKVTNAATATGTPPSGPPPVSPPSETEVPSVPSPRIALVKSAEEKSFAKAGDVLHYDFLVTNTGNVTLTDVTVTETSFSGTGAKPTVTCPDAAKSMAPGVKVACTATYTVTQADVDAGKVTNAATATGTPPSGPPPVSPPSQTEVPSPPKPGISVEKSAEEKSYGKAGDVLHYDFVVTNTGNVTLTDVTVTETAFSGTGKKPVITCPDAAKSVAPGVKVTCTATYTVTQADVDAGKVTNAATATGTPPSGPPPVSPPSRTDVPSRPNPAITLAKTVEEQQLTAPGQVLHYDFVVTNTGNVTLTNVTVTETAFSGTGTKPAITCPDTAKSMAPGANITCTATYTVTQADVDAGKVTNAATATGTPPSGPPPVSPPSGAQVPGEPVPAITVVKSVTEQQFTAPGQVLHYSFVVANTGNVTLTNVTVTETEFSGTGTRPAVTCPDTAKSMAPGANVTCTATYTVTQADVDAGKVTNAATATGTPPSGPPPVSPPSRTEVPSRPNPGIALVKKAEETSYAKAGDVVHYDFLVTNTGNVTLADVTVTETSFSGTGAKPVVTCPEAAKSLAPGANVTCTARYTVTQADVDAGKVTNAATATGTPLNGEPPVSPPSATEVPSTGGHLPPTGDGTSTVALAASAVLVAAGGGTLLLARRRRRER